MLALLLCMCFVSTRGLETTKNPKSKDEDVVGTENTDKSEDLLNGEAIQFMSQNWEEFKKDAWKVYIHTLL